MPSDLIHDSPFISNDGQIMRRIGTSDHMKVHIFNMASGKWTPLKKFASLTTYEANPTAFVSKGILNFSICLDHFGDHKLCYLKGNSINNLELVGIFDADIGFVNQSMVMLCKGSLLKLNDKTIRLKSELKHATYDPRLPHIVILTTADKVLVINEMEMSIYELEMDITNVTGCCICKNTIYLAKNGKIETAEHFKLNKLGKIKEL